MTTTRSHGFPLRIVATLFGAFLMLFLITPGIAQAEQMTVATADAPAAQQQTTTEISDIILIQDGKTLSKNDVRDLVGTTKNVDFPPEVKRVAYLLYTHGLPAEDLNNSVVKTLKDNNPNYLSDDGRKFSHGSLIIAISTSPRRLGFYMGDDLAALSNYFSTDHHVEATLHGAVRDTLRNGGSDPDFVAAFIMGAMAFSHPEDFTLYTPTDDSGSSGDSGFFGFIFYLVPVFFFVVIAMINSSLASRKSRAQRIKKARKNFTRIMSTYRDVALRLDEIDLRAHSLTSPLANDELRRQWEEIKTNFLHIDSEINRMNLSPESTDKEFARNYSTLRDLRDYLDKVINADKNIERLFRMEHGDEDLRQTELSNVHDDIAAALDDLKSSDVLATQLNELDARCMKLSDNVSAQNFMNEFSDLIVDLQTVIAKVQKKKLKYFSKQSASKHRDTMPTIGDNNWHVGYGYNDWYPYMLASSINESIHDRMVSSSSSSSSGGYSSSSFSSSFSGGFSGAGSSSSW